MYKEKHRPKTIVEKRLMILKREYAMTNRQIEADLGVCSQAVSFWLTKYVYPQTETIIKICKTYDVSADWLLGLSDERKRNG